MLRLARLIIWYVGLRWLMMTVFKAQQDPIERLFVTVEGNFAPLLSDADDAIDETKDKMEELGDEAEKGGKQGATGAAKMGTAFGLAATAAGILLNAVLAVGQAIVGMFADLARGAVQVNAQFETFTVQFETLLGSTGAAQKRLEELEAFAVATPFELPGIIEANRTLQVFGGEVLATEENMTLLGDAAASVNAPFQDVAFWVGRLFSALQGGQPFGEASARLQELGLLAPDIRLKLEQMQKAGADGNEIFRVFAEEGIGKFVGSMERLSKTFEGTLSNLEDFKNSLLRIGGETFFEAIRDVAQGFLQTLDENQEGLREVASGLGEIGAIVVNFFREDIASQFNLAGLIEQVKTFIDWLQRTLRATLALVTQFKSFISVISPLGNLILGIIKIGLFPLINAYQVLINNVLPRLDEAFITGAQIIALITAEIARLRAGFAPLFEAIGSAGRALKAFFTLDFETAGEEARAALNQMKDGLIDLEAANEAYNASIRQSAKDIDRMINPLKELEEQAEDTGDALEEPIEPAVTDPKILERLDSLTDQMADAIERRNEQLAKLEEDHKEKIQDIIDDAIDEQLKIRQEADQDLLDLAKDTEQKRLEVIADARKDLAKLATETDKEIESRRDEFQTDELRDTEDHLREMRQLTDRFLADLQDAVRDRDARAVIDIQRRFQDEKSEREDDFSTRQGRDRQDNSKELAEIRKSEEQKREEILASQAEELEELRVHEEQRRGEIQEDARRELEELGIKTQALLDKENQSFIDRQALLEQSLQKQLESIAENLQKQKDLTEEGARDILEALNETFGVGGDIDQLMEAFAQRRQLKAQIKIDFSGPTAPPPPRPGVGPSTGPRLGGVSEFARGGTLLADKPTLALFGENEPEIAQFTPLSDISSGGGSEAFRNDKMTIEFTGSAPPGIGMAERDEIAGVLLAALRETGELSR